MDVVGQSVVGFVVICDHLMLLTFFSVQTCWPTADYISSHDGNTHVQHQITSLAQTGRFLSRNIAECSGFYRL